MPRDLFGDVTRPSISLGNRKWYTVPLSLVSHSVIVGALVVIPLLATDVLPQPWEKLHFDYPITPPAPPPPPPPINDGPPPPVAPVDPNAAPTAAPEGFTPEKPIEPGFERGLNPIGIVIGDRDASVIVAPPPPPPERRDPVRVGGAIRQPQKIRDAAPAYPAIAQAARVQGIVIIEATIGADGQVVNARILRSVPLLDEAALEAVRQWQYTPTLLNGVPVPVIMTVTVQFTLQ
jgi:periplasmic protein TonB